MSQHNVNLTILADNTTARPDLIAEHGFAVWIETPEARILFDTGQGPALPSNAAALNIPLHEAQAIVLSHGHYDHTGGLPHVLAENQTARIFLHPDAFQPRFSRHADGAMHSIGMAPVVVEALRAQPERLTWTTRPTKLASHLWLTGPIPRETPFEDTGGSFYLDEQGAQPDPITDDQALWLETPKGLVVLLGCAHSGVVNTLHYIAKLTGTRSFHAVVGGLHLNRASPARLAATAGALSAYGVSLLMPAHCTGDSAAACLAKHTTCTTRPSNVGERLLV